MGELVNESPISGFGRKDAIQQKLEPQRDCVDFDSGFLVIVNSRCCPAAAHWMDPAHWEPSARSETRTPSRFALSMVPICRLLKRTPLFAIVNLLSFEALSLLGPFVRATTRTS